MAYSRYRYQGEGMSPYGFYNPSMPGPDWGQGIGFFLNQLVERQDMKQKRDEEIRQWEAEQEASKRRTDVYQQDIESRQQPQSPGAANIAIMKEQFDQLVAQGHDPKKVSEWVYGPGREPQPRAGAGAGAGAPKPNTQMGTWVRDIAGQYDDALTRLRGYRDKIASGDIELPEGEDRGAAIAKINQYITNVERAHGHIVQIQGYYTQGGGQLGGEHLNMLRDYAGGMEQVMENGPFISGGHEIPDMPGMPGAPVGGGMPTPQSGAQPGGGGAPPMDVFTMVKALGLPPEEEARLLKTIEELGLTPEQAMQSLDMLHRSMAQGKK